MYVQYAMSGTVLRTTVKEKDLGLAINAGMTVSERKSNFSINYAKYNVQGKVISLCGDSS